VTRTLDGHVALVTGGNGGIGLGMASGLAAAGASVAIWGRNAEKDAAAAETLRSIDGVGAVHAETCDVSSEPAVEAAFASTVEALGKVDSVFANAGIPSGGTAFVDLTLEQWRRSLAVNLDGAMLTLREGARHLVARGEGGSLIAVGSTSSIHGAPANQAYAVAKTGLLALIRSLAVELARHRIRANAVLPGWTDTDMTAAGKAWPKFLENTVSRTPVRRWADPSEFGPVAVYLADPSITFHTGDALVVDGGYTVY
jgi:NAD(P)-dependent dehydrogenase (short-subunit alcohol dehydrogenase family)